MRARDEGEGEEAVVNGMTAGTDSERGGQGGRDAREGGRRGAIRLFWLAGLALALVLAGVVSYYASSSPDGLEKVAAEKGFDKNAEDHDLADSPLADYQTKDVDNDRLSGGVAGVIGVGATLAVGTGLFWVVRRRPSASGSSASGSAANAG